VPTAIYSRSEPDYPGLPTVSFPDWELIEHLADLFRPYGKAEFSITGTDSRGQYAADTVEDIQVEAERRHVSLDRLSVEAWSTDPDPLRASISSREGWSMYTFMGGDEAVVEHLYQRTRDIFEAAAERHQHRLAEGVAAAERQAAEIRKAAREDSWWHNPNPWLLATVTAIVGAVVGGIIVALVT
jgi:hypothetical protein